MLGDDHVEALRGRLVERVRQQLGEIEETTEMAETRATERLLEVLGERSDDQEVHAIVDELRRRGDVLVRSHDLRALLDAYNGDERASMNDEELAAAIDRLQSKVGQRMR